MLAGVSISAGAIRCWYIISSFVSGFRWSCEKETAGGDMLWKLQPKVGERTWGKLPVMQLKLYLRPLCLVLSSLAGPQILSLSPMLCFFVFPGCCYKPGSGDFC